MNMTAALTKTFPFLLIVLLISGCGSEPSAPAGEIILLSHYRHSRISPVAEALAKVENRPVETDSSGATHTTVKMGRRDLTIVNYASHEQVVERLQSTAPPPVAAVLVVVAPDGVWSKQHGEQLRLAKEAGVPVVAVLMSQVHLVDDQELLEMIETLSVKQVLEKAGYTGVPVVRGSAIKAMEDDADGLASMQALMTTLREHVSPLLATR